MQNVSRKLLLAGVLAFGTLTAACGDKVNIVQPTTTTGVTSIAVTPSSVSVSLVSPTPAAGQPTVTFVATVIGSGTLPTVAWRSSNTAVADVNPTTGVATPKAPGTTSIIANAGGVEAAATLTVNGSIVSTVTPQISIAAINQNGVPAQLTNIQGQVDVTVNTTGGAGTIELFLSTTCGVNAISAGDVQVASQQTTSSANTNVTMSINTANIIASNPQFRNGNYCIKTRWTRSGLTPGAAGQTQGTDFVTAVVSTPLTLNNVSFFRVTSAGASFSGPTAIADGGSALNGLQFSEGTMTVVAEFVNYGLPGTLNTGVPDTAKVASLVATLTCSAGAANCAGGFKTATASTTITTGAGSLTNPATGPQVATFVFPNTGTAGANNIVQYQTLNPAGDALTVGGLVSTTGSVQTLALPFVFQAGVNPNNPQFFVGTGQQPNLQLINLAQNVRIDNASPLAPTFTATTTPALAAQGWTALNPNGPAGTVCAVTNNGLPCTNWVSALNSTTLGNFTQNFLTGNATAGTQGVVTTNAGCTVQTQAPVSAHACDANFLMTTTVSFAFAPSTVAGLGAGGAVGSATTAAACGVTVTTTGFTLAPTTGFTIVTDATPIPPTPNLGAGSKTATTYRLRRIEVDKVGNVRCDDLPNPFGVDADAPTTLAIADVQSTGTVIGAATPFAYTIGDTTSGFIIGAELRVQDMLFTGATVAGSCVNPGGVQAIAASQTGTANNGCRARTSTSYTVNPAATEGYYRTLTAAVDQAGNATAENLRFNLRDVTAPLTQGISIPQSLLGGNVVTFTSGASDNVDLKGYEFDVAYSNSTAAYAPAACLNAGVACTIPAGQAAAYPAPGTGIILVMDTLANQNTNPASPFNATFDTARVVSAPILATANYFFRQIVPTGAGGAAPTPATMTAADSGEARTVNVRSVDAALNVSAASTAQIPDINISSAGAPASYTTFVICNNAAGPFPTATCSQAATQASVSNGTGTGSKTVVAVAEVTVTNATTANPQTLGLPFDRVCFYYQQTQNTAIPAVPFNPNTQSAQPYIPIGAFVPGGVGVAAVSNSSVNCVVTPTIIDVPGLSRTWRYTITIDPSASLGTAGSLNLIAIGAQGGVGVATPINSTTAIVP